MNIVQVNDIPSFINHHGVEARKLMQSENMTFVFLNLKPGDEITPHSGEGDTYFFVIEGNGLCCLDEKEVNVDSRTLVKSPKGSLHGWNNTGTKNLVILGIKTNL